MRNSFRANSMVAIGLSQLGGLIASLKNLWGILVFVLVFGLSWMNNFAPLWVLRADSIESFNLWLRWCLNLFYLAVALHMATFLQSSPTYQNISTLDMSYQGIEHVGNKGPLTYLFAAVLLVVFAGSEKLLTGVVTGWWFIVLGVLQAFTLFLKDLLHEQAYTLGPKLTNWAFVVLAMFYLGFA